MTNQSQLRVFVEPLDLEVLEADGLVHDGGDGPRRDQLERLLRFREDGAHGPDGALLVDRHGNGVRPKLVLAPRCLAQQHQEAALAERATPPDARAKGRELAHAPEGHVGALPTRGPAHQARDQRGARAVDHDVRAELLGLGAVGLLAGNGDGGGAAPVLGELHEAVADAVAAAHQRTAWSGLRPPQRFSA